MCQFVSFGLTIKHKMAKDLTVPLGDNNDQSLPSYVDSC